MSAIFNSKEGILRLSGGDINKMRVAVSPVNILEKIIPGREKGKRNLMNTPAESAL